MSKQLYDPSSEPWTPRPYMKRAVKFLLEHACAALFLDPGLGKTSITLAGLSMLLKRKLVKKVLVIAPLRVCYSVWPKEAKKWRDFNHLKIEILHGPGKEDALARDADIYVINPEGLDWLLETEKSKTPTGKVRVDVDVRRFKRLGFDTLVIDELTKFKHTSSGRFKALEKVHKTFGRRWGLTGSPASNGLLDLFGQCLILDEGRSLGQYITHYRQKYFDNPEGFVWVPKHGAADQIYERLAPLALRMAADDYIDMPNLIVNNIKVEMPEAVRPIYEELEEDLITKIGDRAVVATNAGVASMKCRQVANGAIYLDPELQATGFKVLKGKREWAELHDAKLDALEDLIEELQGEPILVAYDFGHDLQRLQKRLGKDVPYIGGGVSAKRSTELELAWNAGELPVLLGHPQSMGHGLNLQEVGHHVAWFAMTWDFELYDQFIRRVWRSGNKHARVFVHHFMTEDTIDETMLYALRSKDRGQQALFKALYELARKRKKLSRD